MTNNNISKIFKVLDRYQNLIECEDVAVFMNEVSFYAPLSNETLIKNMFSHFGNVSCSSNSINKIVLYVIQ